MCPSPYDENWNLDLECLALEIRLNDPRTTSAVAELREATEYAKRVSAAMPVDEDANRAVGRALASSYGPGRKLRP